MSFFDRFSARGRQLQTARAAEARGDLTRAAEAFVTAGEPEEAARIMLLRGDAEPEPRGRLGHFSQAARTAPPGTPTQVEAVKKRATLLLALAGDAAMSAVARHEVLVAAGELEAAGEMLLAADAYRRAGDIDGEARALQGAGEVDRLEHLLSRQQESERTVRTKDARSRDVDLLVRSGRRREALVVLEELERLAPGDPSLRERTATLRSRRVLGPLVTVRAAGIVTTFVLGDEVVIGRQEGAIRIASNAVSREHLLIARGPSGISIRDLGSRNGTQLRGMNLARDGELPIAGETELTLGREVRVVLVPHDGGLALEVAGVRYVACLGPTRVPALGLGLVLGDGGWVELDTFDRPAFFGDVELAPRTTLLAGDAVATVRSGPAVLDILPPGTER